MEDKKIKHLFLAIQKDDFETFLKDFQSFKNNNLITQSKPLHNINHFIRQHSGDSSLHVAARHGSIEILRYLVEDEHGDIELRNLDRKTPLHEASQFSHLDCVEYLLEKGADSNALKKADWSPIMLACTKHNVPVIKSLLFHGSNPFIRNKDGWNSFHLAAREGNLAIVQLLVDFVRQSHSGDPVKIKELCDSRSRNGRKPIHTAALHGHTAVIKFLLENGFGGANDPDNCGSTVLHDACRSDCNDLVDYLIKFSDVNAENKEGYNCLHVAAEAGSCRVLCNLVRNHKMNLTCTTGKGKKLTALQIAVKEKQSDAAEILKTLEAEVVNLSQESI